MIEDPKTWNIKSNEAGVADRSAVRQQDFEWEILNLPSKSYLVIDSSLSLPVNDEISRLKIFCAERVITVDQSVTNAQLPMRLEHFQWEITRLPLEALPVFNHEMFQPVRDEINRLRIFYTEGIIINDGFEGNHQKRRDFWNEQNLGQEFSQWLQARSQLSVNSWIGGLGDILGIVDGLKAQTQSTQMEEFYKRSLGLHNSAKSYSSSMSIEDKIKHIADVCNFIKEFFDHLYQLQVGQIE